LAQANITHGSRVFDCYMHSAVIYLIQNETANKHKTGWTYTNSITAVHCGTEKIAT